MTQITSPVAHDMLHLATLSALSTDRTLCYIHCINTERGNGDVLIADMSCSNSWMIWVLHCAEPLVLDRDVNSGDLGGDLQAAGETGCIR